MLIQFIKKMIKTTHYMSLLFRAFLFLFILSFNSQIYAQEHSIEVWEEKFEEARLLIMADIDQAIASYHKLYEESKQANFDIGMIKAKESLAILYFNTGDFNKVIKESKEVEELALKLKDYSKLAGLYRTLGASYSQLGLFDQALIHLKKALTFAKKIPKEALQHYFTAIIYDSFAAFYSESNGSLDDRFHYLNLCIDELKMIPDSVDYLFHPKYDLLGHQYIKKGQAYYLDFKQSGKAEENLLEALKIYQNDAYKISIDYGITLFGALSEFYLDEKQYEKAIKYGKEGLQLTKKQDLPKVRRNIYNALFKSFLEIEQKDSSVYYANLYTELNEKMKKEERESTNASLNKIIDEKETTYKKTLEILLSILGLVIIAAIIPIYYFRKRNKINSEKYQHLLAEINKKKQAKTNNETKISINIIDETENALLAKLEKFEKSNKFIREDMNYAYLINYIGTNSKYLNEVLKNHKGKSFNQYINDLRVNYIIDLLYDHPEYRQYKISYLAKECGFSSRQVFSIAFKKKTGVLPSYFIENINKDKSII